MYELTASKSPSVLFCREITFLTVSAYPIVGISTSGFVRLRSDAEFRYECPMIKR